MLLKTRGEIAYLGFQTLSKPVINVPFVSSEPLSVLVNRNGFFETPIKLMSLSVEQMAKSFWVTEMSRRYLSSLCNETAPSNCSG